VDPLDPELELPEEEPSLVPVEPLEPGV